MVYSPFFYYQEAQTNVSYTSTPTGSVEVSRLVEGRPAWVLPTLPREIKQRNLVLADWSALNWSEEKRGRVQEELTKLINEGFSLFVWKSGQLVPLTLDTIAISLQKENTDSIQAVDPEDIYAVAAKQKMAKDQIHILDDHWIDCLCQDNCSLKRTISVSNLLAIKSDDERKKIIDIASRAKPPVEAILHDEFSETANRYLCALKTQYPKLGVKVEYKKLVIVQTPTIF